MSRVYDQWLDSHKHDSDEFMHEFETRTDRYLQTEWNPKDYERFMDALFDADIEARKKDLTEAIANDDAKWLGQIILHLVYDYCEDKAKQLAKQDMEQQ